MPAIFSSTPKFCLRAVDIEFACVRHPIPNAAIPPNRANRTASHFECNPRSSAVNAPPIILPSFVCSLYLTAMAVSMYLVAMPNTPVIHIQNTAPGPPEATAVATPIILPVPMVAARAVVSAPNCETSPSPSGSGVTESLIPLNVCF